MKCVGNINIVRWPAYFIPSVAVHPNTSQAPSDRLNHEKNERLIFVNLTWGNLRDGPREVEDLSLL